MCQEVVKDVRKVFCGLFQYFLILSHILTRYNAPGRTQIPKRAYRIWIFWKKGDLSLFPKTLCGVPQEPRKIKSENVRKKFGTRQNGTDFLFL